MRPSGISSLAWIWAGLACLGVLVLAGQGLAQTAPDQVPSRIVMITWRGETLSEKGFRHELKQMGHSARFTTFDCGQSEERLEQALADTAAAGPDLIYTYGTTVTLAAMRRFPDTPIVFSIVSYPERSGIMKSAQGSGCNTAGATQTVSETALLNALFEVAKVKTLGILYNPREVNSQVSVERLRILARKSGLRVEERQVQPEEDVAAAARDLASREIDAVLLPPDSLLVSQGTAAVAPFNEKRIPSVASIEPFVTEHGALFGLTASYEDVGRAAAQVAHLILHGEKPGAIPLAAVRPGYVVNMRTARLLGVTIPQHVLDSARVVVR